MIESIFCLSLAAFLVWMLTPLIRWLGLRFGVVDHPNHRKVHYEPIPCAGGVAIYLSFFGSIGITFLVNPLLFQAIGQDIINLAVAGVLILTVGIYDDLKDIGGRPKLYAQTVIVLIAISLGFRITALPNPFGGVIQLGWWGLPITLFWFLGFINAMNLIDGLDGLAGGICAITATVLLLTSLFSGNVPLSIMMAALAGATLSFLRFNFSKRRKTFLGDNGSMLLGFLLASLSITGFHKGVVFSTMVVAALCLGVPIYDTALAISRRLKKGIHIFTPDKEHIHHKFLSGGISPRETVLIIYGITVIMALAALYLVSFRNIYWVVIVIFSGIFAGLIKRRWWLDKLRNFRQRIR